MEGWQCPECGRFNDRYVYQCSQCHKARPIEGDSHTPAVAPWQRGDAAEPEWAEPQAAESGAAEYGETEPDAEESDPPESDAPARGRFVVFDRVDLVAKCEVCGRYPVQQFSFKGNQGMVFFRRIFTCEGQLCRTCAETAYRNIQSRNLSWGWFGIISFVSTISYAVNNATNYRQGRRELPEPVPSPSVDDAKLRVQPIWATVLIRLPAIAVILGVLGLVIWAIYR